MLIECLANGLCNMLGGRWADVVGERYSAGGRFLFRSVMPAVIVATRVDDAVAQIMLFSIVFLGSCLWFSFGWSFDEIHGQYDASKYPRWVQAVGLRIVPPSASPGMIRLRGIIMKGVRGGYDIGTFALLSVLNPSAMLWYPLTFLMGAVYWACGRVLPQSLAPIAGEFAWGAIRMFLIIKAVGI